MTVTARSERSLARRRVARWLNRRRRLGSWAALRFTLHQLFAGASTDLVLHPKDLRHPVRARAGTSDLELFVQFFLQSEHRWMSRARPPSWFLDLGANVGFYTAYVLSRFPACRAIAVEPDLGNFEALRENLEPYGDRVQAQRAAVWPETGWVALDPAHMARGEEWSRRIVDAASVRGVTSDHEIPAVRPEEIVAMVGSEGPTWMKMDIEGTEALVLGDRCSWTEALDVVAVELHDRSTGGRASEGHRRAFPAGGWRLEVEGELQLAFKPEALLPEERPTEKSR